LHAVCGRGRVIDDRAFEEARIFPPRAGADPDLQVAPQVPSDAASSVSDPPTSIVAGVARPDPERVATLTITARSPPFAKNCWTA
jgi:hypothetical protein